MDPTGMGTSPEDSPNARPTSCSSCGRCSVAAESRTAVRPPQGHFSSSHPLERHHDLPGAEAMDAVTQPPHPVNETVLDYAPGSPERERLSAALKSFTDPLELGAVIGGTSRRPAGKAFDVLAPFDHARVLATSAHSTQQDASDAVPAALTAAP